MKVTHTLEPIYDQNSKILILGSMPSVISRKENFYYANKTNRFWAILEHLFDTSLKTNEEKKEFLIKQKIALWDVIKECDIISSKDSSIKNVMINDIESILKNSSIQCIFCTGKTAYHLFLKYIKVEIDVIYLPSPSSANAASSLETLQKQYQIIKKYL